MHSITRNLSLIVAAVVAVGGAAGGFGDVARRQAMGGAGSPTLSLGQLILRENFDDNERNAIWRLHTDDSANCSLVETNHRLELQAKSAASEAQALYVSNAWRFDPIADFAMKVDLQYTPVTYAKGWVGFGVTTNSEEPRRQQVGVGIGASNLYPHFWYRTADGLATDTGLAPLLVNRATMYLSYSAETDELHISDSGYGAENAWVTFPGLIQGQWGGKPLYIWLGGGAGGLNITSGQAILDNLLIENGAVLEASLADVYRFWSPKTGKHFYTIDKAEKEKLLTEHSSVWTYEGAVFAAFRDDSDPMVRPVYRFWSDKLCGHLYTMDEQEKNRLIDEPRGGWILEGVAFYAYPLGLQPAWACPVYRFWCRPQNTHFYTATESEKDNLIVNYPKVWTYEGIAWYALR